MSQETNLNVSPYFDDFDANNGYYRVLFKPGYPVQARELTTLQSILQNQVEKFGQHFFKEGAKVIPGNTSYNRLYYAVELQNTYLGVPVESYASQLIGKKITGQTSGISAKVEQILLSTESERDNLTLYVSYLSSSIENNSSSQFSDGELLVCDTDITSGLLGNSIITAGQPFASTISLNATSTGSAFSIAEGVYFIRGQFVTVNEETLILDQYSNTPDYRVGLFVNEEIITADNDESLNDNSQGFNNYAAPGADRLRITTSLFKKSLTDLNDNNFIELATIVDGVISTKQKPSINNAITDELARRTYSESGDYYVTPFDASLKESLNDNLGNNGIFSEDQFTYGGSTPSKDLAIYQISPGKAFVRGYECETTSTSFLDCPKPRTTKTLENQSLNYNTGSTLKLNRIYGAPEIGIGNTYVLSLRDSRVGSSSLNAPRRIGLAQTTSPGKEIGVARVYDFALESGSYDATNQNLNQWDISLYDIQTFTEITLNQPKTLPASTFIKGKSSGATAFLKDAIVNGTNLTVYQKTGDFIKNESFSFNGIDDSRVAVEIKNYGISDIQSVYGTSSLTGNTFSADVIQSTELNVGLASVSASRLFQNEVFLTTNLSQPLSAGSTTFYVDSVNDIVIGSLINVGLIKDVPVVSVGNTFVQVAPTGIETNVSIRFQSSGIRLNQSVGIGSTIVYLSSVPSGIVTDSTISIAYTGGSTAGYAYSGFTAELPIVSVGNSFVYIGAASTISSRLTVNLQSTLGIGSTEIFITPGIGSAISVGSSISVGSGLTNVPVTLVSASGTSVFIGTGSTVGYAITSGSGVAVTFSNLSPLVVGSGVSFFKTTKPAFLNNAIGKVLTFQDFGTQITQTTGVGSTIIYLSPIPSEVQANRTRILLSSTTAASVPIPSAAASPTRQTVTAGAALTVTPPGSTAAFSLSSVDGNIGNIQMAGPLAFEGETATPNTTGRNVNPDVRWSFSNIPSGVTVRSYRVVLEDMSVATKESTSTYTHWDVIVPATVTGILTTQSTSSLPADWTSALPTSNTERGTNGIGYNGPWPNDSDGNEKESHIYKLSVTANLSDGSIPNGGITTGITTSVRFRYYDPNVSGITSLSETSISTIPNNLSFSYISVSSAPAPTTITNLTPSSSEALIVGVGTTFVYVSTAGTFGSSGITSTSTLSASVGIGSTIIYLSGTIPNSVVGAADSTQSRISVAYTGGATAGYAYSGFTAEFPIVAVGNTFVYIGAASTSSAQLTVDLQSTLGIGSTQIFISPGLSSSIISVGSSISVGSGLTNVPVTLVSASGTSVFIGTGSTVSYEISIGSAVTFTNLSPLVVGAAVSFTNLPRTTAGIAVSFFNAPINSSSVSVGSTVTFADSVFASRVVSPNQLFPGKNVKTGSLISYTTPTLTNPFIGKVISVGTNDVNVIGVTTVNGICDGRLPASIIEVSDLKVLGTKLETSSDNTLYTRLPKTNISNVDLSNSTLNIRKIYTGTSSQSVNISQNQTNIITAESNETFAPFDSERYILITSGGKTEVLTSDRVNILSNGTQLQILNLETASDSNPTLIATLIKSKPTAKVKRKNRVNSIIIDKSKYDGSGIGSTTLNDGLTGGDTNSSYPFGTRVQDEIISLNVPDILEIHGIFQAADATSNVSAPTVKLTSINGPSATTSDLVVGELVTGQTSGAIAIFAERVDDENITFIYKNQKTFKEGETLLFGESEIQAIVQTIDSPSFDVSSNFTFDSGQEGTFYDYGTIIRKSGVDEPNRKLKVYFSNSYYELNDDGDITTAGSYNTFDYGKEVQTINGIRNTDIIDIRPKTSTFTVTKGGRSPLEFYGRTFNQLGNSAKNILASDETISTTFSFYLGRIDRIYLTKDGQLQVKYGTPSEKPESPVSVDDALEVATINLPPYLYNISQASIQFLEHKRYRMVDIKQLENRIKNLEYYTALSLLETNTANLFIPDSNGLNRFKSGFFVDNFSSLIAQEDGVLYKNSIDIANKQLRPRHYTNSIDLINGPVTGLSPDVDLSTLIIEGTNVRRSKDIITLNYNETDWLSQTFATKSVRITQNSLSFYQATMELTPSSDTWMDMVRLESRAIQSEGSSSQILASATRTLNIDPQTGFAPVIWSSWETNWTGQEINKTVKTLNDISGWKSGNDGKVTTQPQTTTVTQNNVRDSRGIDARSQSTIRTVGSEQFDSSSAGDRAINRNLVSYMRSRNIQFVCKNLRQNTQVYAFLDGVNVTRYCVPKLLEISMISGTFEVGEKVIGVVQKTGLNPNLGQDDAKISFRVATANHKEGQYNSPTSTFAINPYTQQALQSTYSSTSTILNVDIFSLSNHPQGEYSGWVESDMVLVGQRSKAQARITNVRLISDSTYTLIGSLYIPNPNANIHPKFETGNKTFTLTSSSTNDKNNITTNAEEAFLSSGIIETVQGNIISVRNARIQNRQQFQNASSTSTTGTQVTNTTTTTRVNNQSIAGWSDPLAQSFIVNDPTGIFLTSCQIFFGVKDNEVPVSIQIRTIENGFPSQKIIPFSEVTLEATQVQTSTNGSTATTFEFDAPVYLEGGKEYCICLISNSNAYQVFVSETGKQDLIQLTPVSTQLNSGLLFKPQNTSGQWEASQLEDLKFVLRRADFLTSGTVDFYNPELSEGNKQITTLMPNSLNLISKRIRIGFATDISISGLTLGNTVIQQGTNVSGNYVGAAGSATETLNIINSGIGYTPSSGSLTINDVNLVTVTGSGKNATANITVSNGVAIAATISDGGVGYQVGDVVTISQFGSSTVGRNARFSIVSLQNTNQLILDNVQGDFVVGSGRTVQYINSSGVTTSINGGGIFVDSIETVNDGLHIKVNHQNHGMYSSDNYVKISDVLPDVRPTRLTTAYTADSTAPISVENASAFSTFENVGVGTTNRGYLLIDDEVITYESVSGNSIGGTIVRGANAKNYPVGTPVYKYELGGVSLGRINRTHYLNDVTVSNPITFDSYHIRLDMSSNTGTARTDGSGYPKLYINESKSTGGFSIKASQNIPYEVITPVVHNLTLRGTSISALLRTVTSTSISGNEVSFADNGFEFVSIGKPNYLSTPRIVCSKVNEDQKLTNLPGNKSLNLRLQLDTTDTKLSPVIDAQRVDAILTSNRVNSVISNYATDSRVNTIDQDPSAFQYISKEINLENSASSIKIILNAHINQYCDIRALYAISDKSNFSPIFIPFPGYLNLDSKNEVINFEDNDGRSDVFITPSQSLGFETSEVEFKEYTFTIDKLPSFRSYRVKLILTSTSQVYVPRVKDIRVIALA
jgi:hypothetical protein